MEAFKQAALDMSAAAPAWLQDFRDQARDRWMRDPMPTRRTEHWKYTTLVPLVRGDYLRQPEALSEVCDPALVTINGLDASRLVFVNGRYHKALSSPVPQAGVELLRFADADASERVRLLDCLGTAANDERNPFTALNACWLDDGLFIDVAKDVDAGTIHVVHLGSAGLNTFCNQRRGLLRLGNGARATLVEHFISSGTGQHGFVLDVTELILTESSSLRHYRLHLEDENSLHIGGIYARIAHNASLDSFLIALGSQLKRIDLDVAHQGPGSQCRLNGVYLPRRKQHVDLHVTVDHEQAQGTTEEVFRGIIDDEASAVFNGRIHIHPKAQKTNARLSNRNLLLSDRAEIYTKPELEIYADDVQCAHGATVSQIDAKALYYLRSRGIDRREAEVLLSFAFINELIEGVADGPVRVLLRSVLRDWFGAEEKLKRHLA